MRDDPSDSVHDEAHYGYDKKKGAVVAEEDPDASARDPESRAPARGETIPASDEFSDDAEGAGGKPRGSPGTMNPIEDDE